MTGHGLDRAIKNEFSGDIMDGLIAILQCTTNKAEFFASRLHKSMAGIGTNDNQLIRLVVTRCEIDLNDIKVAFERLYGKSLRSWIKVRQWQCQDQFLSETAFFNGIIYILLVIITGRHFRSLQTRFVYARWWAAFIISSPSLISQHWCTILLKSFSMYNTWCVEHSFVVCANILIFQTFKPSYNITESLFVKQNSYKRFK